MGSCGQRSLSVSTLAEVRTTVTLPPFPFHRALGNQILL